MARVIRPDGTRQIVRPSGGPYFTLADLELIIGAPALEILGTNDGRMLVIDARGYAAHEPVNVPAMHLRGGLGGDPIYGVALLGDVWEIKP